MGSPGHVEGAVPVGQPVPLPPGPPMLEPATTGFPPPVANPGAMPGGPGFPPPVADPGAPLIRPGPAGGGKDVRLRRVAAVALWACVLAIGGLVVGIVALVKILSHAPGWFEPVVTAVGVIGIGLTAAAFPAVNRRSLPWLLLSAATVTLVAVGVLAAQVS